MRYVVTRQFATAVRQYQGGEELNTATVTTDEFIRGIRDGSVIPASFYGTAAQIAAMTTPPGPGVSVYESDTGVHRIGDGSTHPGLLPQVGNATYVGRFTTTEVGS